MPVHNTKYNYTREEDSVAFSVLEFINKMLPSKSSVSDILKFVSVAGNNKRADAKIAGITPAVFIFNGRWEESPPYILLPICLLG